MIYLFRLLRNNLFGVLSTVLFLFGYWQVMRFNEYQSSIYFNASVNLMGKVTGFKTGVTNFLNLPKENANLVAQNKRLLLSLQNRTSKRDSNEQRLILQYSAISARIINGNTGFRNNTFAIDKGKNDGIYSGQAVIGPSGVVGIISDLSDEFAIVLPLINSKLRITPDVKELEYVGGEIFWNGYNADYLDLEGVSKFKPLKVGMNLITSKYSKAFPPGIAIGTIHSISQEQNSSFFKIKVKTASNFHALNNVYVIKNNYQPQIDTLLNQSIINENDN